MEIMNLYIDADSLLYRASHLVCCKDDNALAEAQALAEDVEGIYTVALEYGSSQGERDVGNITHTDVTPIRASNDKEAHEKFAKMYGLPNTGYVVTLTVELDEEDIELEPATAEDTLGGMKRIFHSMVNEIVEAVNVDADAKGYTIDDVFTVLTVKPKLDCCKNMADNFRYNIMEGVQDEKVKGYKANRAGMPVPDGLNDIYEYVFGLDDTICVSGVEADDVCVYYGQNGHMVAALDKDVLGSLEYAYNYGKKEWIENYPEDIKIFPYFQTITGDSSDGLRGVYRVGAKGAEKALLNIPLDDYELWKAVVKQYYLKEQSLEEAIATMRSVSMTQWTPDNGLVLWTPPTKGDIQ